MTRHGTKEILSDRPDNQKLSPIEIMKLVDWPKEPMPHTTMHRNKQSTDLAYSNDEDGRFRKAFASPANKETLLAHLVKATVSMPIKGTNKDSPEEGAIQTMLVLNDIVEHLLDAKVTEVDLFIALYELAETEEFFPSLSKIKRRIK